MGYPTKIQLIKRQKSEQWYINFPSAIAQAMEFDRGEIVEWLIEDKQTMTLKRSDKKLLDGKKKLQTDLWSISSIHYLMSALMLLVNLNNGTRPGI